MASRERFKQACVVFAGDHVSELDGANVFGSGEQHSGGGESEGVL